MKVKYNSIAILRSSAFIVAAVCAIGISQNALSQEILKPNQISGKIVFNNTSSAIRNMLSVGGFNDLYLSADSIGITPVVTHYTYPTVVSSIQANYQLTVESSAVGIPYNVAAEIRLGNHKDKYVIWPRYSAKVYPEPATDVALNIYQCISMLDIKFVDAAGSPVALNGGSATAYQEKYSNGKFEYKLQAQSFSFSNGATRKLLAVNGNAGKYRLDVITESGNDASSNIIRGRCHKELPVPRCDQIVPVTCVVGAAQDLGQIYGAVDVLGEDIQDISYLTRMRAFNGPLDNYRYDHVAGSGDYLMENLVPSNTEIPAKNYMMYGEISFGTGFQIQYIRTPWLGQSAFNSGVAVEAGKTINLGNTFVLDPGFISGLIVLAAPPVDDEGSFLHDLQRNTDVDYDQDGVADYINLSSSHVEAKGLDIIADSATVSANGGLAKASFEGSYDAEISSFVGDYRMSLGGLNGEASVWGTNALALHILDDSPAIQEGYRNSYLKIRDNNISNQVIVPGSSKRIDHSYCMNDIVLAYKSLAGTFFNPQVYAKGTFVGTDFMGKAVDQSISLQYAYGVPRQLASAATQGYVNLALPQGSYEITPKLTAVNPDGTLSYTELSPVSLNVACRQTVTLTTNLQLSTDELPLSTEQSEITVSGSISSLSNVAVVKYVLNESAEVIVCNDCGISPTYTFNVPLISGDNKIVVVTEDEHGDVSTSSSFITSTAIAEPEPEPEPFIFVGCSNITVDVDAYETSAEVDFAIETEGGCGASSISCNAESGDVFPLGTTAVSCNAVDSCGKQQQCQFNVEVKAEIPVCGSKDGEIYTVSSAANINQLWPPNRKFSDIGLIVTEKDPCAELSENSGSDTVTTVWSDEPELEKKSNARLTPDAKNINSKVKLRAERSSKGNGRVYLLISKGISVSGDNGIGCLVVTVPHDMSVNSTAETTEEAEEAKAYCEANNGLAPSSFYQIGFEYRDADKAIEKRADRIKEAEKVVGVRKAKRAKKAALAAARDATKAEAKKAAALLKAKKDAARAEKEVVAKKAALAHDKARKAAANKKAAALLKTKKDAAKAKKVAQAKKAALARNAANIIIAKRTAALLKAKEDAVKVEEVAEAQKIALDRKIASETAAILRAIEAARAYSAVKAVARKTAALKIPASTPKAKVKSEAFVEKNEPSSTTERMKVVEDDVAVSADAETEVVVEEGIVSADEELQDVLEDDVVSTEEELDAMVEEDANAEEIEAVVEENAASAEEEAEEEEVVEEEAEATVPQEIVSLNEVK